MPFEDPLKDTLSASLDHIAVTWNDAVKDPLRDSCGALVEAWSIARTSSVPDESLLGERRTLCAINVEEDTGKEAA